MALVQQIAEILTCWARKARLREQINHGIILYRTGLARL